MKRKDFLKTIGMIGVASIVPIPRTFADSSSSNNGSNPLADCWLTPASTEGPFYFDPQLLRSNVVSDSDTGQIKAGLPLNLTIQVVDINCNPVPNVLVDIWHCDAEGVYSGYPGQLGGLDTTGLDFLRGTQMTDSEGKVNFTTIYPGWYPGRTTHIHFKARLTSMTYVTSQFAFDESVSSLVYQEAPYNGDKDTTNQSDGVFHSASPTHLMVALTPSLVSGYDGTFTIGVNAPQSTKEDTALTGGQFSLQQNFPNPVSAQTTFNFWLLRDSLVKLEIFDINGNRIASILDTRLSTGEHSQRFDITSLRKTISAGNYLFQLQVENSIGLYRQSKVMTVL